MNILQSVFFLRCLKFDVQCSYEHRIHVDVVWFGKGIRNHLGGKADADFKGIRPGIREDAIIKTFSAAEASAFLIKGKAGADEGVDFILGDERVAGGGFHDAETAGSQFGGRIGDDVKEQRVAVHPGINPSDFGMSGDEIEQVDLTREGRKDGDGFNTGMLAEPLGQRIANGLRAFIQAAQVLTHGFAEGGFLMG